MRFVKSFIVSVIGFFILITLLSLLLPSKVVIVKGVVIHADTGKILKVIRHLSEWKSWHPAFKSADRQINCNVTKRGIDDFCEWETKGKKNKIILTDIHQNKTVFLFKRKGEYEITNTITLLPLTDTGSVQAEWKMQTKLKWYPWEKFYGIFIEKSAGAGYEDALQGLKVYAENN